MEGRSNTCPCRSTPPPLVVAPHRRRSSKFSGTAPLTSSPPSNTARLGPAVSPGTPRASQPHQHSTTVTTPAGERSPASQQSPSARQRTSPTPRDSFRTRDANRPPLRLQDRDTSSPSSHWSDDVQPLAEIDTSPLSTPFRLTTRRLNKAVTFTDDTKTNDGDSPTAYIKYGVKRGKPTSGSPVYERPQHTFNIPRDGYMPRDEVSAFSDSSDDEGANGYDKLKLKRLMHMRRRINLDVASPPNLGEGPITDTRPSLSASNTTVNFSIPRQLSLSSTTDSTVSPARSVTSPIQRRQPRVQSPDLIAGVTGLIIDTSYRHHFQRNSDSSCQSTISNSTLPTPTSSFTSDTPSFTNPSFAFAAPLPPVSRMSPIHPVFQSGTQYAGMPLLTDGGAVKRLMRGIKERGSLRDLKRAVRDRKI